MNPPTQINGPNGSRRYDHYSEPVQDVIKAWRTAGVTQFVYFIQEADGGPVKIGTAADPLKRCAMLQCGNHRELIVRYAIPGDATVETSLHHRFCESRTAGEWFDMPEVVLAWAAGMEARAHEHMAEHGLPPVAYIQDQRPINHIQREALWEKVRIAKRLKLGPDAARFLTDYGNDETWFGVNVDREYQNMLRAGMAA